MGQKTNPIGLRLGINKTWDSRWCDQKNYARLLKQDMEVRYFLTQHLKHAGVAAVSIERPSKRPRVTVQSARPGVVIGKRGGGIEKLRQTLCKKIGGDVSFNVMEVRKPELDARLVAINVAQQLEKRVAFRRAMRRAVQFAMKLGAKGIRINCAGRLGGAEIARTEWLREGRVPLHKLRADISYGKATAFTSYGTCGVKVWIYLGDVLANKASKETTMSKGG